MTPHPRLEVPPEAARALVGAPVGESRGCPAAGCGAPLVGRQRACSGKCRAALSRARRQVNATTRDAELRRLADAIIRLLDGRGTR
jgi:predicted nucleic acid-binding Zn ribbon protein